MTTTDPSRRLDGVSLIGEAAAEAGGEGFRGVDAASGESLEPLFHNASPGNVDRACALAEAAFDEFRATRPEVRAVFLETIAQAILDLGDQLILRAMAETGLPRPRLEGERGRTVGQLRLFAAVVRDGSYLDLRIDPALPDRAPLPRPDLRLRNIPLGPVAVFGASNFPLAFSVAGGDTASALAAGCPAVVKAHPAHPGVSELVGRAVQSAVRAQGLPEGVFSLLFDAGHGVGSALAADPRIKAVGFTGSRAGGLALMKIAQARAEPIPVYAEMSSINPVILLPVALAARGEAIGTAFVGSLTLGAGQFCTNPGLILAVEGEGLDRFLAGAAGALRSAAAQTMLTPGIHKAYCGGAARLGSHAAVELVARGLAGGDRQGQAALFVTTGEAFRAHRELQDEVFGASSLVVSCRDLAELRAVLAGLDGQLTAAVHADGGDQEAAATLLPVLERKVGRILFNGFGTGVEVAHAMVHGGPYPATSDSRTTSVGSLAIARFLRPVSYQDVPQELLPPDIADKNAWSLPRMVDGVGAVGA